MNTLPSTALKARLNAFLAATVVTLAMLSGIDQLAAAPNATVPMAQGGTAQAV
jgi:hypothetical protein